MVRTPRFHFPGPRVQSLDRELRSRKTRSTAKILKKKLGRVKWHAHGQIKTRTQVTSLVVQWLRIRLWGLPWWRSG